MALFVIVFSLYMFDKMIETINNMMIELYASMAQAEMEKKEKRQKEGMEAKRLRGEWDEVGRPSISNELSAGYGKPRKPPFVKGDKKHDLRTNFTHDEVISLGKNLHNVLWGGGGTTDTEVFNSLVNIILAKIQDEDEKKKGQKYDFQIFGFEDGKGNTEIEKPEKVFDRRSGIDA